MRVVLTCLPYYSHLVPVVLPVAGALRRAGHHTAIATAPAMAPEIHRAGHEHLPLPHVRTLPELLADPDILASPGMPGAAEEQPAEDTARARADPGPLTRAFAGPLAGIFARDLIDAATGWRPDLVVRECNEFGGHLAAERLGLAQAVLDIAPFSALNLPFVRDSLNAERDRLGLSAVDDPWHPQRCLLAGVTARAWYPEELRLPSARYYRPDPAGADLPGPPAGRPFVLAGLGTVAPLVVPETPRLLAAMITALGELDCSAVVSLGSDPADWDGPRPDNVRLTAFAPQRQLLHRADLLLSHGGFGGVYEALLTGTPMVSLPLFADQPDNARRITELGLGLTVPGADPAALRLACERVLTEASFRREAEAMSVAARQNPGYQVLAEDLAALV